MIFLADNNAALRVWRVDPPSMVEMLLTTPTSHGTLQLQVERSAPVSSSGALTGESCQHPTLTLPVLP